jgi:hypothetical protein
MRRRQPIGSLLILQRFYPFVTPPVVSGTLADAVLVGFLPNLWKQALYQWRRRCGSGAQVLHVQFFNINYYGYWYQAYYKYYQL